MSIEKPYLHSRHNPTHKNKKKTSPIKTSFEEINALPLSQIGELQRIEEERTGKEMKECKGEGKKV